MAARRRALRAGDVVLAALGHATWWAVVITVLGFVEAARWQPGDAPNGMLPTWVFALLGFLPVFIAAAVVFVVPALLLRAGARAGWFFLAFVPASIVSFALLALVIIGAPGEMLGLDWGLQQLLVFVVGPAVGGLIAGLVAWRRARWREDLTRSETYPASAPFGGPAR